MRCGLKNLAISPDFPLAVFVYRFGEKTNDLIRSFLRRVDGTKLKIRRLLQIACAASDLCKNEKEKV